ncbi:hypothetical protein [Bifidobacterium vansinderenii]|uniref:Uncharacterized protein n=1 Tax=Bifidobacterium vansinderenii TaxID=1984871 RepID=A0A229W1C6_9BIFI|nr:hypothetical protein [Bifidobacterium vansinderenii]OXN01664.1 hypothetical protein Tam10B_0106 [Bifidobacterium vansinderenii]
MAEHYLLNPDPDDLALSVAQRALLEARSQQTMRAGSIWVPNGDGSGAGTMIGPLAGGQGMSDWVGDTTVPPRPTGLGATSTMGIVAVTWDGRLEEETPPDFDCIEIRITLPDSTVQTLGRMSAAGELTSGSLTPGQKVTVTARSYDRAHAVDGSTAPNVSADSDPIGVTVSSAIDDAEFDRINQDLQDALDQMHDLSQTVTSIDGKTTVSGSAPTTADANGKPEGAMWTQIDSTGKVLGMWVLRNGTWIKTSSDATIPDGIFDDINNRLDEAEKDLTDLSKTVTSIDGKTTVSGKAPTTEDAKTHPEGAMWTQIDSTGKVLGMWVLRNGAWVKTSSDVTIPDSAFDEVNKRIDQAIKDMDDLGKTVTSIDGKTTVSGSAPTTADAKGRPEGAMWTQIDSTGKVLGMWVLRNGTWLKTSSDVEIPDGAFDDINNRLDEAEKDLTDLSKTVTSIDGKSTVSGKAPTTADATGRPEGAMWVQLGATGQPLGRWYLHDGAWIEEKAGLSELPSWVRTDIDQALAQAKDAKTTADGKNRIFAQTTEPTHTGRVNGDLWRKLDASGNIIGEYVWNGTVFVAHAITADSVLLPGSATGSTLIKPGSITVGTIHIGSGEILTELLKARKITTSDISTAGLDAGVITTGYLSAARIKAGSLDASQVLVKGSVGSVLIADGAITSKNISIGNGEILTELLKARKITTSDISTAGLDAGVITSGYISAARIKAGSLDASQVLVPGSVDGGVLIKDGTITAKNIKIGNGEILTELLKARKITSTDISTAGLDAGVIKSGYINAARIQAGSLDASKVLVKGSVGSVLIADGAITAKNISIGNGEILTELLKARKITTGDITADGLDAGVITTGYLSAARIKAGSLDASQVLVPGSIDGGVLIKDGTITAKNIKIGNGEILTELLKARKIVADDIQAGAFSGYTFTGSTFQSTTWGTPKSNSWQLNNQRLEWWNDGVKTIYLDGTGKENLLTGTFQTGTSGNRVVLSPEFTQFTIGGSDTMYGSGISFPMSGTYAQMPYIATEASTSTEGDVSALTFNGGRRDNGSLGTGHGYGAFGRLGMRRDSQKRQRATVYFNACADYDHTNDTDKTQREWNSYLSLLVPDEEDTISTLGANSPTRWGRHWVNVSQGQAGMRIDDDKSGASNYADIRGDIQQGFSSLESGDVNGTVGIQANITKGYVYLGGFLGGYTSRQTFQTINWLAWGQGMAAGQTGSVVWTWDPPKYGGYHVLAQPVCEWSEVQAHPKSDHISSQCEVTFWNGAGSSSDKVYCNGYAWLHS